MCKSSTKTLLTEEYAKIYTKGIVLEPAVAAVLMSASTVIVAINALLLKRQSIKFL